MLGHGCGARPATCDVCRACVGTRPSGGRNPRWRAGHQPTPLHANAAAGLTAALRDPFQRGQGGPGGWIILPEPELHLREEALVPDLAGWRRTRMPALPHTAAIELAPDWVCEVLSPSTEARDRGDKMPSYA